MIKHYIITACRCIMKYKTQNLISVLGLSVALFCFSICLYCSRYIYSTDDCFENRGRIVQLTTADPETGEAEGYTFCDFSEDLKKYALSGVETYVYTNHVEKRPYNVEVAHDKLLPYTLDVMETDSAYLRVFAPKVLFGSWEQASHTPNSIILSEKTARRIFGQAETAVGRQMVLTRRLNTSPKSTPVTGGIAYTIQAVAEDLPENNSLNFLKKLDAWVLNDSEGIMDSRMKHSVAGGNTYALLQEGVKKENFCRELKAGKLEVEYFREKQQIVAYPFGDLFWEESPAPYLAGITMTAGVLMLLVGMLNFFHFLTGSFVTRIREYSLRRVSGARGRQLWAMLFVQSALLVLLSGWFTMMLMELTAPFLSINLDFVALTINRNVMMQQAGGYLLGLLACCMITAALVVWKVQRINIQRGLFGGGGIYGKHRIRNVLLGIQLFICWIFVSLTTALYLQSQKSADTLLGTLTPAEKEEIYSISLAEYTFLSQEERMNLIAELGKVPGVKAVLPAQRSFDYGVTGTSLFIQPKREREYSKMTTVQYAHPSFFEFMNIPLQAGVFPRNEQEITVTRGFEEHAGKEMLGQLLYDWDMNGYTVTAICQPMLKSLRQMPDIYNQDICVFLPLQEEETFHCYVKCEPGQKKRVGKEIEHLLRSRLPESIDIRLETMMDDIRKAQSMEFELRGIVGLFSVVSITIVLLGIYAAITLDTEYRRKEMAIRKINGAGMKQIALIFAKLYIWLLVVTAVLAFPIVAFALEEFAAMYALFVHTGILFYGSIFVAVTIVVALTVGFRIYQIARVNPAEIIKKE
ncbi:MAG: ABC transporter permease [Bacteroides sp.]|nr:ABC transporter permease [Bacteroides sp.]